MTWGTVAQTRPPAWEPGEVGREVLDTVGTTVVARRDTRARLSLRGRAADGVWGVVELATSKGPIPERRMGTDQGIWVAALGVGVVAVPAGRLATGVARATCVGPMQAGREVGPERVAGTSRPAGREGLVGLWVGTARVATGDAISGSATIR